MAFSEKSIGMVQGEIAKLIAKYETLLVAGMNRSESFDSDAEDDDEALLWSADRGRVSKHLQIQRLFS